MSCRPDICNVVAIYYCDIFANRCKSNATVGDSSFLECMPIVLGQHIFEGSEFEFFTHKQSDLLPVFRIGFIYKMSRPEFRIIIASKTPLHI